MQVILFFLIWLNWSYSAELSKALILAHEEQNLVSLEVGERTVFDSLSFPHATVTVYSNQILFSILDGAGQHVTVTLAGEEINTGKPQEVFFKEPGLFHGYSENGDVFFMSFGKLDEDREEGQIKYDLTFPQNIMDGKLTIVSWTAKEFEFHFEGKLGNENQVDSPQDWVPFTGLIKASNYQLFTM